MTRTIVKVQIPIATNDPRARALVYAKGKTFLRQMFLPFEVATAMSGDAKAFFFAEWKDSKWIIGERTDDQDW